MEILCDGKNQRLVLRNAFDLVSPLAGNLDCRLYSLSTGVHWQDHVESEQFCGVFSEAWEDIVVECSTAEGQSRRLLGQRLYKLGMAVALVHSGVC